MEGVSENVLALIKCDQYPPTVNDFIDSDIAKDISKVRKVTDLFCTLFPTKGSKIIAS